MTYVQISRCRDYQSRQRSSCPVEANPLHRRGCNGTDASLCCFQTTGIPLYPSGAENTRYNACSRAEGSLYHQASQKFDRSNTGTCKIRKGINQPHRNTSLGGLSQKGAPWLRPGTRYRCFTALTDWVPTRLPMPIVFWYQTMAIKGTLMIREPLIHPRRRE